MNLWLIGLVSLAVTCVASPLVRNWLIHHDVLDRPNERSSHRVAIPRGGGVACILGIATGSVAALASGHDVAWPVLLATLAMALVGLADDRFQLPAAPRLASQVLVGTALGASLGGPLWAGIGAVVLPLLVNVVNFMDGINGITALTLALWGVTAAIAGFAYESPELAALGAVGAGAALGFLPWNAPRAKLFLGDVGSYTFGALAAGGLLLGSRGETPPAMLLAPLAVYLIDVTAALVRRTVRRAALTEAHREHVYQRLVDTLGMSHLAVAGWTAAVALALTLLWSGSVSWWQVSVGAALLAVYLGSVPLWRGTMALVGSSTPRKGTA